MVNVADSLQKDLKSIFNTKRVTLDSPVPQSLNGMPQLEQGVLFVEVDRTIGRVKDKKFTARVQGTIKLFAQNSQLPMGFFIKQISQADAATQSKFIFTDMDENSNGIQNLVQRSASFIYFYSEQYDPDQGEINELDLTDEG